MRAARWALWGLTLVVFPALAQAGTLRVPADYATIQAALDQSALGDTVLVAPGTYSDWTMFDLGAVVAVIPDGVALVAEAGPAATVIDLAPLAGVGLSQVAFVHMGHTSGQTVIDGFHVVGFTPISGGVSGSYSSLIRVRNCVFEGPDPVDPESTRKGISSRLSELLVTDCTFIRCSGPSGAGISHTGGVLTVQSCTFIECENQGIRATDATGGGPHRLEVRDCLFQGNRSAIGAAGVSAVDMTAGATIDGCRFEDMTMEQSGAVSMSSLGPKSVTNCVFHDIELPTGSGGCLELLGGACTIVGNTMTFTHQVFGSGAAVDVWFHTDVLLERNIIAYTTGAPAVSFRLGGSVTSECNVFWENVPSIGYAIGPTDRVVDPQFCDPDGRDLTLQPTSPCLPPYSLGCDLIGALGQGCGTVSIEPESWAKVKAAFRDTSTDGRRNGKE